MSQKSQNHHKKSQDRRDDHKRENVRHDRKNIAPRKTPEQRNGRNIYEEYWSQDKVRAELNESSGKLFQGKLKINPKRRKVKTENLTLINTFDLIVLTGGVCRC